MTIAQTKAARKKFRQYYRNDMPIGTPHYNRRSPEALDRQRQRVIEKQKLIASRKGMKK